jgi:hypothetical protein
MEGALCLQRRYRLQSRVGERERENTEWNGERERDVGMVERR